MSSIESLVEEVKDEMFFSGNYDKIVDAFVYPSAYDTAWLAMIPYNHEKENGPMFNMCLNWIVGNQKEGGFWGEEDEYNLPTIDALPATLACLLALKTWNVGHQNIQTGMDFIYSKVEIIVRNNYENLPRWFILTFPAMIELAITAGLHLVFPPGATHMIAHIFIKRRHILQMEKIGDKCESYYPPLVSYLETLPPNYHLNRPETVNQYLSYDGSLYQSPSATAQAFIITGNVACLGYLKSILQQFPNGVPAKYPIDGDLIKLCLVDQIQGLGLAEYFDEDIDQILAQVNRNRNDNDNSKPRETSIFQKLFKDALAFRLLRMQGHYVNPGSFCWFLHEPEMVAYMEENPEQLISTMYSVYKATDLQFSGENEMDEARTFAIKMLRISDSNIIQYKDHNFLVSKGLQNMIKYELDVPWVARLDHPYHRKWIEEIKASPPWIGKASFYRLSCLNNNKLLQLAVKNFELRQMTFKQELEELQGWSKKWRLSEMGFGREKTVYCYFGVSCCLPLDSVMRLVIAKAAIIVTVADDFYDTEGSMAELETLTSAVKRWDSRGLQGHSKTIFDALDDFVNEIAATFHDPQERSKVVTIMQHLWRETFDSWMVERTWSSTGYVPSMDEYLATGMTSIAAHTIALPTTNFLTEPSCEYRNITKLLMAITRLVNDTQSYKKEQADGKLNLVLLHSKENQNDTIEDSIAYVNQIIEMKRKEFIKHVFMDGDMHKSCRRIHLSCMKVFQMFFNSGNLFDSETVLMHEIQRAIYIPIVQNTIKTEPFVKPMILTTPNKKEKISKNLEASFSPIMKQSGITSFIRQRFVSNLSSSGRGKPYVPMKLSLSFI
ncbi:hypothetical protein CASFOL_032234 [Castilleja foliolosa]|uniref:Uncharacterized protein n=1 Tax=Castilleja foliolosa TaxID=1961234 RepID=A0ABD3C1R9_9LAMI